jgi:hypothetical protein
LFDSKGLLITSFISPLSVKTNLENLFPSRVGDFPDGVSSIFYKIDNKTRPKVKLRLSGDFDVNQILSNPLTQPKQREKLKEKLEKLEKKSNLIEYTVSGFREEIDRKLLEALKAHQ